MFSQNSCRPDPVDRCAPVPSRGPFSPPVPSPVWLAAPQAPPSLAISDHLPDRGPLGQHHSRYMEQNVIKM